MIYDKRGVIQTLDQHTVMSFIINSGKPLVIYGVGQTGMLTFEALKKNNIEVAAFGDGATNKHYTTLDGKPIYPAWDIKEKYPDAIIWVTITDEKTREIVINLLNENGVKKDILIFDILNPWSNDYYMDFDMTLPVAIIGVDENAKIIAKAVKEEGIKVDFYCILANNIYENVDGIPVISLSENLELLKNHNVVICDKNHAQILQMLNFIGVYENIFRDCINTIGQFSIQKYNYSTILIRRLLQKELCFLNYDYYTLEDLDSRNSLKRIISEFFNNANEKKLTYYKAKDQTLQALFELEEAEVESYMTCKILVFNDITKDIVEFTRFMKVLNYLCVKKNSNIKIELSQSVCSLSIGE